MNVWRSRLSAHILAASATGLLGIGLINQVAAQDEDNQDPAAQQADQAGQDTANNDAVQETSPQPAPQQNSRQEDVSPASDEAQNAETSDDVAPPRADDLNFDDQRIVDDAPPALPGNDDAAISPSDRQFEGRRETFDDRRFDDRRTHIDNRRIDDRREVRRYDYDDPSQPIPQDDPYVQQGQGHGGYGGCHPCATRRVYHNPCGGCGNSYGYGGYRSSYPANGYSNGYSSGGSYQTRNDMNRPVIGITIDDGRDGVRIVSVVPNSPAEQAGLQSGDHVVAISDQPIRDSNQLMSQIRGHRGQLQIAVDRNGEEHQFDVGTQRYAQVFGQQRGNVASAVPNPPANRFAQQGEPRTAFRPNYAAADDVGDRLERVRMRIGQLERELTALRQEEQDLQNVSQQDKATDQSSDDANVDDVTPSADEPMPADGDSTEPDDAVIKPDDDVNEVQTEKGDEATPPAADSDDSNASDEDAGNQPAAAGEQTDADLQTPDEPSNRERLSPSAR
jgi:hypothetical protein